MTTHHNYGDAEAAEITYVISFFCAVNRDRVTVAVQGRDPVTTYTERCETCGDVTTTTIQVARCASCEKPHEVRL